jgi:hypothetical protein
VSDARADPDEAGADVPSTRDAMGADEALTRIALGRAIRLGTWQRDVYGFSRVWPLPDLAFYGPELAAPMPSPGWPWSPSSLLAALLAEVAGLGLRRGATSAVPKYLDLVAAWTLEHLLQEAPAADLAQALGADLISAEGVNGRLRRAAAELRDACGTGRLQVLAAAPGEAAGERKPLPSGAFHFGVEMCPDGTLRELGAQRVLRTRLLFRAAEVSALRPLVAPEGPAANGLGGAAPPPGTAAADPVAWMRQHVEDIVRRTGRPPKMVDAEAACCLATRCTTREARQAWKAVPPGLKRPSRGPRQRQAG